jgi:hypothetical protein
MTIYILQNKDKQDGEWLNMLADTSLSDLKKFMAFLHTDEGYAIDEIRIQKMKSGLREIEEPVFLYILSKPNEAATPQA